MDKFKEQEKASWKSNDGVNVRSYEQEGIDLERESERFDGNHFGREVETYREMIADLQDDLISLCENTETPYRVCFCCHSVAWGGVGWGSVSDFASDLCVVCGPHNLCDDCCDTYDTPKGKCMHCGETVGLCCDHYHDLCEKCERYCCTKCMRSRHQEDPSVSLDDLKRSMKTCGC